ncbi:hypothetical protein, partial [Arthrobacter yangruifuii]|uniref:hypothetical protein n=1 Tax=Arthrobacter yangruifuii TaxID=2606616 RepID=UPI001AED29CB
MDVSAAGSEELKFGFGRFRRPCGGSLRSGLQGPEAMCKVIGVAAAGTLEKRPSMAAKPTKKPE